MCKQAEPGTPNLKPGTAPGPSVAKKVCRGTAYLCSGATRVPKQLVHGRAARIPEITPLRGRARGFWFHLARKGEKPSSLPHALSEANGQMKAARLQWSGHDICRSNARAGWKCDLKSRLLGCLGQTNPSLDFFRTQAERKQLFLIFWYY